ADHKPAEYYRGFHTGAGVQCTFFGELFQQFDDQFGRADTAGIVDARLRHGAEADRAMWPFAAALVQRLGDTQPDYAAQRKHRTTRILHALYSGQRWRALGSEFRSAHRLHDDTATGDDHDAGIGRDDHGGPVGFVRHDVDSSEILLGVSHGVAGGLGGTEPGERHVQYSRNLRHLTDRDRFDRQDGSESGETDRNRAAGQPEVR